LFAPRSFSNNSTQDEKVCDYNQFALKIIISVALIPRSSYNTLDEKDCGGDVDEEELTNSQPTCNTSNLKSGQENESSKNTILVPKEMEIEDVEILNTEDDVVIDDFDDEW
jgi:hypothetical protein